MPVISPNDDAAKAAKELLIHLSNNKLLVENLLKLLKDDIRLYTIKEVAHLLKLSRGKIWLLCKTKELEVVRIGSCIRIPQLSLRALMLKNGRSSSQD